MDMSNKIVLKKATEADIPIATRILRDAAQRMMDEGKQQWSETYPTEIHVRADVDRGVGYVLESEGAVIGYCAIVFDGEPAYNQIQGEWLSDKPYIVVHRMALRGDMRGKGFGRLFMELVERYAIENNVPSFRIDTNFDNFSMLALVEKLGFTYCGDVTYESGSRRAFEKLI